MRRAASDGRALEAIALAEEQPDLAACTRRGSRPYHRLTWTVASLPPRMSTIARPRRGALHRRGEHVGAGTLPCISFGLVDAAGRTAVRDRRRRPGLAVAEDSIFFLASISKAIVATAVMQYVDEGRLDLHAPLARYLPELDGAAPAWVSAWHVLTHTSGLPDIPVETLRRERPTYQARSPSWAPASPPGRRAAATSTTRPPGCCSPRPWRRLSGMPFAEALEQRLTRPLGMADTSFDPRHAALARRAGARLADGQPARPGAAAALPGPRPVARRRALRQPPGPPAPGTRPAACRWHVERSARPDRRRPSTRWGAARPTVSPTRARTGACTRSARASGWRKPQREWPGSERAFTHGGISGGRLWVDPDAGFAFAFLTNLWQAPLEPALEILEAVYRAAG